MVERHAGERLIPLGTARERWLAGRCPCCGAAELDNNDEHSPKAIAEGVMICGWCVYRHHDAPDVAPHLLMAVATGVSRWR